MKKNIESKHEINPSNIYSHTDELEKTLTSRTNKFPIYAFPKAVQAIITDTNDTLNFPIDFIGASILYATSVAIGNTHRVEIKKGWSENASIYLALVGRAGTNKSHPIRFALKPIENLDNHKFQQYQNEKLKYETVSEGKKQGKKKQDVSDREKPYWDQRLISDFTPEALADVHKYNIRGLGVYTDELASWFNNFNRYSKGSEEQFWLSAWNGISIRINRKTSEPTYILMPFISVIGTIQPGVLHELADKRTENGFLDRLLFVAPDNLKKEYWNEKELLPETSENWHALLSKLLELHLELDDTNNPLPIILQFNSEAKRQLFEWQRALTDECNYAADETECSINAKIEMYAARLALILQLLRYASGEDDREIIGLEAVQGAIELAEYFRKTAIRVHYILENTSPIEKLPLIKKSIYNALPKTFTTGVGVQLASNMGMAERSFKRFLSKRELFSNNTRGEYEKLY